MQYLYRKYCVNKYSIYLFMYIYLVYHLELKSTGANRNEIMGREIIINIILVREIVVNMIPARIINKTYCFIHITYCATCNFIVIIVNIVIII